MTKTTAVYVGAIVIYHDPGSADGKHQPQNSPAILQAVNKDGWAMLWVFGPRGLYVDWVLMGDGPCQWSPRDPEALVLVTREGV